MRIDQPFCNLKPCHYSLDGNCTAKEGLREGCEYNMIKDYGEILYNADGQPIITLDRLAELVDAERDGRVVVLPCNVGDPVYFADSDDVAHIVEIRIISDGKVECRIFKRGGGRGNGGIIGSVNSRHFGETVFLTRAAAEQAKGERE